MSASWCLVSMYLIWILELKLILSNNQSRATLWVLDTCLIAGLRPFHYHLNHCFIVLKDIQHSIGIIMFHAWWNVINVGQIEIGVRGWNLFVHVLLMICRQVSPWLSYIFGFVGFFGEEWNTSITKSQRSRAGIPSMRKPVSREITSASVELCETEICFLHIQLIGTNGWLPKMHRIPPDVDFESSKSAAKSESWNNPSLRGCAVFPTSQYCRFSLVWWM